MHFPSWLRCMTCTSPSTGSCEPCCFSSMHCSGFPPCIVQASAVNTTDRMGVGKMRPNSMDRSQLVRCDVLSYQNKNGLLVATECKRQSKSTSYTEAREPSSPACLTLTSPHLPTSKFRCRLPMSAIIAVCCIILKVRVVEKRFVKPFERTAQ